ncbi:ACP phosphodiesterase [Undibacterium sp. Ji22W]|uniref:acyl carrier protein phosphodiesterase n=1 Tax=Undibacterium sp. Ji22W TaxID=3413038 RepID=UPI003BF32FAD
MNYLAHIYLARHSHDAMLGALLGDFVKMDGASQYQSEIAREILLHRKIDSYTDQHAITQQARSLFASSRRRYAGIALDIFYDHLLAQHWQHYSEQNLQIFIQEFYRELLTRSTLFPSNLAYAAPRMVVQDWLGSYTEFDGVKLAIDRVSTRLSRNGHLLRETITDLQQNYDELNQGFLSFFPDLQNFVTGQRAELISL